MPVFRLFNSAHLVCIFLVISRRSTQTSGRPCRRAGSGASRRHDRTRPTGNAARSLHEDGGGMRGGGRAAGPTSCTGTVRRLRGYCVNSNCWVAGHPGVRLTLEPRRLMKQMPDRGFRAFSQRSRWTKSLGRINCSRYCDFICLLAMICLTGGSFRITPRMAAMAR